MTAKLHRVATDLNASRAEADMLRDRLREITTLVGFDWFRVLPAREREEMVRRIADGELTADEIRSAHVRS